VNKHLFCPLYICPSHRRLELALTLPSFLTESLFFPLGGEPTGHSMDPAVLPGDKESRALEPTERSQAQPPELPRELWVEIIGMAVATPLTNPDFLTSCIFHEELPIFRQLKILRRNDVCL
jgi:hypothetical protein